MKKFLSLALTFAVVLSLSIVAFADETSESSDTSYVTITKTIDATGLEDEIFSFSVTGVSATDTADGVKISDYAIEEDGFSITIEKNKTSGSYTIKIPTYGSVGIYTYKITETEGATAGVSYDDTELYLVVTVTNGTDGDFIRTVALHSGSASGSKEDVGFANEYGCGSLTVSKSVTGNLGDKTKAFTVAVTFTSESPVNSVISYTDDNEEQIIAVDKWKQDSDEGAYTVTVEITLKDDETVTFKNIPAGVSYEVVEDDYTNDGYDEAEYNFGDDDKTISKGDNDTVAVTNNKGAKVDTGINLDSLPYVMMLVVVAAAAIAMMMRRRRID